MGLPSGSVVPYEVIKLKRRPTDHIGRKSCQGDLPGSLALTSAHDPNRESRFAPSRKEGYLRMRAIMLLDDIRLWFACQPASPSMPEFATKTSLLIVLATMGCA